jgi:hypothetical protein
VSSSFAHTITESVSGDDNPGAAAIAQAVREELAVELARLDAAVSTRATPSSLANLTSVVGGINDSVLDEDTGLVAIAGKADTIGNLATGADGFAATKAAVDATQAVTDALSPRLPGSGTLATGADVQGVIESAAGILTDVDQETVDETRVFRLVPSDSEGLVAEKAKSFTVGTSPTFAVDFRADLPVNGRIVTVNTPTIESGTSGGITFASQARNGSLAKFRATGVTAGNYTVRVGVTYDTGATSAGTVRFVVAE